MSHNEESFMDEECCTSEEFLSSSDDSSLDEGPIIFIEKLYAILFQSNKSPYLIIYNFLFLFLCKLQF